MTASSAEVGLAVASIADARSVFVLGRTGGTSTSSVAELLSQK